MKIITKSKVTLHVCYCKAFCDRFVFFGVIFIRFKEIVFSLFVFHIVVFEHLTIIHQHTFSLFCSLPCTHNLPSLPALFSLYLMDENTVLQIMYSMVGKVCSTYKTDLFSLILMEAVLLDKSCLNLPLKLTSTKQCG